MGRLPAELGASPGALGPLVEEEHFGIRFVFDRARILFLDDNGGDMSVESLVASSGRQLFGRENEREVLDRLLDEACGGVLVVHGEAGVGKTALLDYAIETARVFRVFRASGVEAEMELPYAASQLLCSPFFDFVDRLPPPQREALGVAFGLGGGPPPDPFLVGLAVLGLLSEAAMERPLLVAVDARTGWTTRRRGRSRSLPAACRRNRSRSCSRRARSRARLRSPGSSRLAARTSRCAGDAGVGPARTVRRGRPGTDRCRNADTAGSAGIAKRAKSDGTGRRVRPSRHRAALRGHRE